MYVAITRARKRLYLSFSQTRMLHGQTRYNVKSRFVDELPEARAALDHAAQPGLRLGLRARVQPGLVARLGAALDRRHGSGRAALPGGAGRAEGAVARPAPGAGGLPRQVRRGRRRHDRGRRRRRARPGQFRPPRHEMAGAEHRQADAGRLTAESGSGAPWLDQARRAIGQSGLARRRLRDASTRDLSGALGR